MPRRSDLAIHETEEATLVLHPYGLAEKFFKRDGVYTHEYEARDADDNLVAQKKLNRYSKAVGRHVAYEDGALFDDLLINFFDIIDENGRKATLEVGYYNDGAVPGEEEKQPVPPAEAEEGDLAPEDGLFEIAHQYYYNEAGLVEKIVQFYEGRPHRILVYDRFEEVSDSAIDPRGRVITFQTPDQISQFRNADRDPAESDEDEENENEPWQPYGFDIGAADYCDIVQRFRATAMTVSVDDDIDSEILYFDKNGTLLFRENISMGTEDEVIDAYAISLPLAGGGRHGKRLVFDTNARELAAIEPVYFKKTHMQADATTKAIYDRNEAIGVR